MKLDELLIVIERLIDTKLQSVIPSNDNIKLMIKEEISKYVNDNIINDKVDNKPVVTENVNNKINTPAVIKHKPIKNPLTIGNPLIDNIFSEIAASGKFIKSEDSMVTMQDIYSDALTGDGGYRTIDGNAMLGAKTQAISLDQTKKQFENMGADPDIANNMIKDYSKLLKKSEELTKRRRG